MLGTLLSMLGRLVTFSSIMIVELGGEPAFACTSWTVVPAAAAAARFAAKAAEEKENGLDGVSSGFFFFLGVVGFHRRASTLLSSGGRSIRRAVAANRNPSGITRC